MRHHSNVIYPILISSALYGVSLAVTALEFEPASNPLIPPSDPEAYIWPGWKVLLMGYLAIFNQQIAWYANVLHFFNLGLMAGRLWRLNIALCILALVVALNTLLLFQQEIPMNGAGSTMQLHSLRIGFYFWMTSLSIPLLWNMWQCWMDSSRSSKPAKKV